MGMYMTLYAADAETVDRLRGDDEAVLAWLEDADSANECLDLDKGWDLVGRLLTGELAGLTKFASEPLHEEDLGYGPALLLPPENVQALRDVAEGKDADAVRAYMQSAECRDEPPYPYFEDLPEIADDEEVAYYASLVADLRAFLDDAIERGCFVISVLG